MLSSVNIYFSSAPSRIRFEAVFGIAWELKDELIGIDSRILHSLVRKNLIKKEICYGWGQCELPKQQQTYAEVNVNCQ